MVHISSDIRALVLAIILGRRRGYEHTKYRIHNIPFVVLGASMLWFAWFGFNAGFVPIWASFIIGALVSPICYFGVKYR